MQSQLNLFNSEDPCILKLLQTYNTVNKIGFVTIFWFLRLNYLCFWPIIIILIKLIEANSSYFNLSGLIFRFQILDGNVDYR